MRWKKIAIINILLTLAFIGVILLIPPTVYNLYKIITNDENDLTDFPVHLELYKEFDWTIQHFTEFKDLSTTYNDFITWRTDDLESETINIKNGLRQTYKNEMQSDNSSKYYFFGGSTTWGTGVNDDNTFPSMFAKLTGLEATNYGEKGYIARQSLAYLSNHIIINSQIDMNNIHVIFYDGVNEVVQRCRSDNEGFNTSRAAQIKKILKNNDKEFSFSTTFRQLENFIEKLINKFKDNENLRYLNSLYNCDTNKEKAQEVAQTLINTWKTAADLVNAYGGTFTAILQPVAYIGNANIEYLNLTTNEDKVKASQYKTVYPLIKKFAKDQNFNFIDLTNSYDGCSNCYIDFCHVGPQGHKVLTSKLIKHLLN
tara:strand:+ start:181 stop:1290 length:1110 start_codon:yes stop_codon:yes gene_type:complete